MCAHATGLGERALVGAASISLVAKIETSPRAIFRIQDGSHQILTLVKYFTFKQDGLESRLMPLLWKIKGCKTILEVGFAIRSPESNMVANIYKTGLIAIRWLLSYVIFTISVPIMFPVAGTVVSDIGRAASPVLSKMAAMIAEQFVQLSLSLSVSLSRLHASSAS